MNFISLHDFFLVFEGHLTSSNWIVDGFTFNISAISEYKCIKVLKTKAESVGKSEPSKEYWPLKIKVI